MSGRAGRGDVLRSVWNRQQYLLRPGGSSPNGQRSLLSYSEEGRLVIKGAGEIDRGSRSLLTDARWRAERHLHAVCGCNRLSERLTVNRDRHPLRASVLNRQSNEREGGSIHTHLPLFRRLVGCKWLLLVA